MLGSGGWALNAKQEAFAREYIVDRNGTQAAIRAGYSEKGASVHGSRLLRNVQVRALIDELIAAQFERLDITTDRVFEELAAVAFSNIGRYATVTGDGDVSLFPWSDMPEHGLACIAEISETPVLLVPLAILGRSSIKPDLSGGKERVYKPYTPEGPLDEANSRDVIHLTCCTTTS